MAWHGRAGQGRDAWEESRLAREKSKGRLDRGLSVDARLAGAAKSSVRKVTDVSRRICHRAPAQPIARTRRGERASRRGCWSRRRSDQWNLCFLEALQGCCGSRIPTKLQQPADGRRPGYMIPIHVAAGGRERANLYLARTESRHLSLILSVGPRALGLMSSGMDGLDLIPSTISRRLIENNQSSSIL